MGQKQHNNFLSKVFNRKLSESEISTPERIIVICQGSERLSLLLIKLRHNFPKSALLLLVLDRQHHAAMLGELFEIPVIPINEVELISQYISTNSNEQVWAIEDQYNDVSKLKMFVDFSTLLECIKNDKTYSRIPEQSLLIEPILSLFKPFIIRSFRPLLYGMAVTICGFVLISIFSFYYDNQSKPNEDNRTQISEATTNIGPTITPVAISLGSITVITPTPTTEPKPVYEYTVEKGQSYWSIALKAVREYQTNNHKEFDINTQRRIANQLVLMTNRESLYAGQKVIFDTNSMDTAVYTIIPSLATANP
ncbi:hypothetical protein HGA91_05675 [candidate division WWE3 bacterium]|nr:hypothetical protein [candidate division WWE3 bacterium]